MNIVEKVSSGGISEIFKIEENGMYFAFKTLKHIYKHNMIAETRIKKEYRILKQLNHENIIKCYCWVNIESRDGFLMEFINGRSLKYETMSRDWTGFEIIRNVINYLQNLNPAIIHNDVSENNILIDNFGQIKLIDFSSAFFLGEKRIVITKERHLPPHNIGNNELDIDITLLNNIINSLER